MQNNFDVVMSMYNLTEYSDNYSKASGSIQRVRQYFRDKPNDTLIDYESFKSKVKITEKNPDYVYTKGAEIAVSLKYLSNLWRTVKKPLIDCEINLILALSSICVTAHLAGKGTFTITITKYYVSVVTLSTQDNTKLLQELKSSLKKTVNWNKY